MEVLATQAARASHADLESRTMRAVMARILPIIGLGYLISFLDRVNISFAALEMNADLGLSATQYGLGAGLFFLTYTLFEIPSNALLVRFGARRWIARIMLSWGLCCMLMAFVTGPRGFYAARLLLGAAEAGFFPGILYYMTLWFPAKYRARVLGYFFLAVPMSFVIGSPLSGALLNLDGLFALKGWQWMIILEALPAVVLSFVVWRRLSDRPDGAQWLAQDQRVWLVDTLAKEQPAAAEGRRHSIFSVLADPRLYGLALVYFADAALNNGISFFLPQIVKSFGTSNVQTGMIAAIPSLCSVGAILWVTRSADRYNDRRWHAALALLVGGTALALSAVVHEPLARMMLICIASSGTLAFMGVFWAIPPIFFTGPAAAGGLAAISSLGILGGFVAPYVVGYSKDITGSFATGQIGVAAFAIVMAFGLLWMTRGKPA
jgi:MFS family permease